MPATMPPVFVVMGRKDHGEITNRPILQFFRSGCGVGSKAPFQP
jgi:hypothetical protein